VAGATDVSNDAADYSPLAARREWVQQAEDNNKKASSDLKDAMNEMENVFAEPEMLNALKQMAHVMPKVAHGAASFLEFLVNHPFIGGSALVGAKVGLGFLEGFGSSMTQALSKKIVAEVMAQKMTVIAKPIVDSLGTKIGEEFIQVASAPSPWKNAGALLATAAGIGIAAYLAIHYGMKVIDADNANKAKSQGASAVGVAVAGTRDVNQIVPALAAARARLKAEQNRADFQPAVGGVFLMPTGGHHKTPETEAAREAVNELEKALKQLTRSSKDASGSLDKVKASAGDAASNGLPSRSSQSEGWWGGRGSNCYL